MPRLPALVRSDALVLATGVVDAKPPLPGLVEHYGRHVFVCPLCDGHEIRGGRTVILGAGGPAGAFATELRRWTSRLTIVPFGDERPTDEVPTSVRVHDAPARAIVGADELEGVVLTDGSVIPCDAVFMRTATLAATDIGRHLGCETDPDGLLVVDHDGRTNLDQVYAAGDCTPGPQLAQIAAAEGTRAGLCCAQDLHQRRERAAGRPS